MLKLNYSEVMEKANEKYAELCKANGRFCADAEIVSLQLKAVTETMIDEINKKFREINTEMLHNRIG